MIISERIEFSEAALFDIGKVTERMISAHGNVTLAKGEYLWQAKLIRQK
jgi:hypothetical protein